MGLLNMLQVIFTNLVEDEDAIQIYNHKRVGERPQDVIHHPHNNCKGIFQPERHEQPLKKALRFEGGFPYIYGFYWNLVIARLQIYLAEILGPLDLVKKAINTWDWIPILDIDFIYYR